MARDGTKDANHNDILREVGALGGQVDRLADETADGFDTLRREMEEARKARDEIFRRLRAIEIAKAIEDGVDEKVKVRADRFRKVFYELLRMFVPPGAIGALVVMFVLWWTQNHPTQ
ncbi:hypothetical protein [Maricaulis maris]|uniref:hypothetical protein n=1 Tax=Maricaulis maris TaxID=74318 RepID=UPI003B8DCB87